MELPAEAAAKGCQHKELQIPIAKKAKAKTNIRRSGINMGTSYREQLRQSQLRLRKIARQPVSYRVHSTIRTFSGPIKYMLAYRSNIFCLSIQTPLQAVVLSDNLFSTPQLLSQPVVISLLAAAATAVDMESAHSGE